MNVKTAIFVLPEIPVKILLEASIVTAIKQDGTWLTIFASKALFVTVTRTFAAMICIAVISLLTEQAGTTIAG